MYRINRIDNLSDLNADLTGSAEKEYEQGQRKHTDRSIEKHIYQSLDEHGSPRLQKSPNLQPKSLQEFPILSLFQFPDLLCPK